MATTRIIAMHAKKGQSIGQSLGLRTDYVKNGEKTEQGKYISAYECDPVTVDEEFVFVRQQYDRHYHNSRKADVIAYQIRQAFKPGEITAERANELGYELAMRFTKGKHQFIVATHTDKEHIHNHIIFNSVSLDSQKKFRDFLGSGRAVRKISDIICIENNLSVIKNPKRGNHAYGKWLGDHKKPTNRDYIKIAIDNAIKEKPNSFNELIGILKNKYNVEVAEAGKQIKLRCEGQKKFARISSLGAEYSKESLEKRIRGDYSYSDRTKKKDEQLSLLINVQKKMQEGKGVAYEKWAKKFNLKQTAKTLSYLADQNINSYDSLEMIHKEKYEKYENARLKIKELDSNMDRIKRLQNAIITYIKTKDAYQIYKKSGYDSKIREKYFDEIATHEEARKHFDRYQGEKLPTIKELKEEFAKCKSEKDDLMKSYYVLKRNYTELAVAKKNIDVILEKDRDEIRDLKEKNMNDKER